MAQVTIIDDIVSKNIQAQIYNAMSSYNFPWFYQQAGTVNAKTNSSSRKIYDFPQFCHTFYKREEGVTLSNSENTHIADLILQAYISQVSRDISVLRCKANFQLKYSDTENCGEYNPPHIDLSDAGEYHTAIYYVCDSDGDTFFFDNNGDVTDRISPKMGRFLVFDGNILHAGNHPRMHKERIVINYGFKLLS